MNFHQKYQKEKFWNQWQSKFNKHIEPSKLSFNSKPTMTTLKKSKNKPAYDAIKTTSNERQQPIIKESPKKNTSFEDLDTAHVSYLQILNGYRHVAPKPSDVSSHPRPSETERLQYSSENVLSNNILQISSSSSPQFQIWNQHERNKQKRRTTAQPRFKKQKISSTSLTDAIIRHQVESSNKSKDSNFTETESGNAIKASSSTEHMDINNSMLEYRPNLEDADSKSRNTENGLLPVDDTAALKDAIIKVEAIDSDDSVESDGNCNMSLQSNLNVLADSTFQQQYCMRVTLQLLTKYPRLKINTVVCPNIAMMIIYPQTPVFSSSNGMPFVDYIRLVVKSDETYNFQVFHQDIQTGRFDRNTVKSVLEMMTCQNYVLCRGLPSLQKYEEVLDLENSQTLRSWVCLERIDTKGCLLWHQTKPRSQNDEELFHVCRVCRELVYKLRKKMQEN